MMCPVCGNPVRVMEDARESLLGLLFGCEVCNKILEPKADESAEDGFGLQVSEELSDQFECAAIAKGYTLAALIKRLDHMGPTTKRQVC